MSDKLYWRRVGLCTWHCYASARPLGFVSLCGKERRAKSGGQAIERPAVHLRCGLCDAREMRRRGWDHSGPTTFPTSNKVF